MISGSLPKGISRQKQDAGMDKKIRLFKLDKSARNYISPAGPRYAANHISTDHDDTRPVIKIVTYNINFSRKTEQAISTLKNSECLKDIDILCLQEMDRAGVERMSRAFGFNYVYYPSVRHPLTGRDFGNAILSRSKIADDRKVILKPARTEYLQRSAVGARIRMSGTDIAVFNIHMKLSLSTALVEEQLIGVIEESENIGSACIITGDFNDFRKKRKNTVSSLLKNNAFIDAAEKIDWSFTSWHLLYRKFAVDHIFIRGINSISCSSVKNLSASDHLPVFAELKLC
jgi:endonuclease/exonuclease/phosphatase family metal-dependent hydrolase